MARSSYSDVNDFWNSRIFEIEHMDRNNIRTFLATSCQGKHGVIPFVVSTSNHDLNISLTFNYYCISFNS